MVLSVVPVQSKAAYEALMRIASSEGVADCNMGANSPHCGIAVVADNTDAVASDSAYQRESAAVVKLQHSEMALVVPIGAEEVVHVVLVWVEVEQA